ncbi:MAG TPA: L,D-transpeptidase family protein [Allosphingosinicella sp.]|nr:L,D-transpeptidase family protein [Allosphingosinicella sp.]
MRRLLRAAVPACLFVTLLGTCTLAVVPVASAPVPAPAELDAEVAAFYRARQFRPLWLDGRALKPAARTMLAMAGNEPRLAAALAAAEAGDRRALSRADLMLSQAFADRARARFQPPATNAMRYIDPGLAPAPRTTAEILGTAAGAPDLAAHVDAVARVNPPLAGLERGLTLYRQRWSRLPQTALPRNPAPGQLRHRLGANDLGAFQRIHGLTVTGRADPATIAALNRGAAHYERLIRANIERARAIPARPGGRYILVDTASAQLFMVENSRIARRMRVVVGKRAMQTPLMAGMIRYAMLNPYWNLPPDLIRERARKGLRAIQAEHLEVLSDWSPQARRLDPRRVDWRAVAAGRRLVNLRQTPGPHNMMGRIKFMLPNDLGIYLHDTPHRELFARADRRASSGCVRLEDAGRLERWLFGARVPRASGAPEQRVDLPAPVPVYITYLTVLPTADGVVFQRDAYSRDVSGASAPRRGARARHAAPAPSRARHGRAAAARPVRRP